MMARANSDKRQKSKQLIFTSINMKWRRKCMLLIMEEEKKELTIIAINRIRKMKTEITMVQVQIITNKRKTIKLKKILYKKR